MGGPYNNKTIEKDLRGGIVGGIVAIRLMRGRGGFSRNSFSRGSRSREEKNILKKTKTLKKKHLIQLSGL